MLNSRALAKVQTVALIAVVGLAIVGGSVAYFLSFKSGLPASEGTPTPTLTITPVASPTPIPTFASQATTSPIPSLSTRSPSQTATPASSLQTFSSVPTSSSTPAFSSTPTAVPTSTPTSVPTAQSTEPIRIGLCADLDATGGTAFFRGATMAVEQINAEGGILGRKLMLVAEDDDGETSGDISIITNSMTRLITVDKADFVIAGSASNPLLYQDLCCTQKKILLTMGSPLLDTTQRVLDNYDQYKYYFRSEYAPNATAKDMTYVQSLAALKKNTGFTKVGYLFQDTPTLRQQTASYFDSELPKLGFEVVYRGIFASTTVDFTSYFAQAEASKAQILFVVLTKSTTTPTLVNEWYERQSPMLLCGDINANDITFWNTTSGKTEFVLSSASAIALNYPVTNWTLPVRQAFLQRWGVPMKAGGAAAYDSVRFILPDAIKRAGTTETDAVIKALEKTNVDTSQARGFEFTSNHDIMVDVAGMTSESSSTMLQITIQWQNGVMVPIFPESLRLEAGATYKFPTWPGPWGS